MNAHYQWLLFDADGTLFDYDLAEDKALAASFKSAGYDFEPSYLTYYREINAQMWLDFEKGVVSQAQLRSDRFKKLFEALGIVGDPVEFSDIYLTKLGQMTDLIKGAEELLSTIYGQAKLLLVTNGIKEVQRSRLALSPIKKFFSDVIISGEVGVTKPDGRFFDLAFQAMGNPDLKSVLIIGDSLTSDIRGGLNYGIDSCWYNPKNLAHYPDTQPTYEIQELSQLLPIIGLKKT